MIACFSGFLWKFMAQCLVSCASMGPYGALHAPKTGILLSSGTYSYVCSKLRYQAGGSLELNYRVASLLGV
jgi:hypothetical protein